MDLTLNQLATATGARIDRAQMFLPHLLEAMDAYGIDTAPRMAAFLAQIGHESGGLRWAAEIWGPTKAQSGYEGRKDLGNTQPGDGSKFRGHGLIQTTGRANHAAVRDRLRVKFPHLTVPDFEADPEALMQPRWAALSAADFWDMKSLNLLADVEDFMRITRRVNGGTNGYEDRLARYEKAKQVLG
ncbi:MAG: glycoside hydrolase family 19 protein [Rhodocyclaceae bacterium]